MNKAKKLTFLIFFLILIFSLPFSLFPQEIEYPPAPGVSPPAPGTTFPEYVRYLFNLAIRIVGVIAFLVLIWASFLYFTSGGNVEQKEGAKKKMKGAFIGIFILLSSYLILYTINPQLVSLSLQEISPTEGIFLIDENGKSHFLPQSHPDLSFGKISEIRFISPASSLLAVYIYDEKNYRGNEEKIPNSPSHSFSPPKEIKSVYFLWNKAGVYLCSVPTSENICPKRPFYTSTNIPALSQTKPYFDNLAQSLQIVGNYEAVLFTDPGYEGKCSFSKENISDLSAPSTSDYNNPPLGNATTSSIIVSLSESPGKPVEEGVKFYNRINCKGGEWSTSTLGPGWIDLSATTSIKFSDGTPVYENILSLKIEKGFGVLLNTEPDGSGICQFFKKPEGETNCISTLVGEPVYDSTPEPPEPGNQTKKVRSLHILYYRE